MPVETVRAFCKSSAKEAGDLAEERFLADKAPSFTTGFVAASKGSEKEKAVYNYCLAKDGYQEKLVCIKNCDEK